MNFFTREKENVGSGQFVWCFFFPSKLYSSLYLSSSHSSKIRKTKPKRVIKKENCHLFADNVTVTREDTRQSKCKPLKWTRLKKLPGYSITAHKSILYIRHTFLTQLKNRGNLYGKRNSKEEKKVQKECRIVMDEVFKLLRDFPGSTVVGTSPSNVGDVAFIPVWGAKIPRASQPENQSTDQKQYCNKFNEDFKNGPH